MVLSVPLLSEETKQELRQNVKELESLTLSPSGKSVLFRSQAFKLEDVCLPEIMDGISRQQKVQINQNKDLKKQVYEIIFLELKCLKNKQIVEKERKAKQHLYQKYRLKENTVLGKNVLLGLDYRLPMKSTDKIIVHDGVKKLAWGAGAYEEIVKGLIPDKKTPEYAEAMTPEVICLSFMPFAENLESVSPDDYLKNIRQVNEFMFPTWWEVRNELEPYLPKKYKFYFNHLLKGNPYEIEIMFWCMRERLRGNKFDNSIFLIGKGGIGKSLLSQIHEKMFGKDNVLESSVDGLKDKFNSKKKKLISLFIEEGGISQSLNDTLKINTNKHSGARGMRVEEVRSVNHANDWIAANFENSYLDAIPTERRYFAFTLAEEPFLHAVMREFGLDLKGAKEWIEFELLDEKEMGNFCMWLLNVWKPHLIAHTFGNSIPVKTNAYYDLLIRSNSPQASIIHKVFSVPTGDSVAISSFKYNDKKIPLHKIIEVLDSWESAGIKFAEIEGTQVVRLADSIDDLRFVTDPFGYREKEAKTELNVSNQSSELDDLDVIDLFDDL